MIYCNKMFSLRLCMFQTWINILHLVDKKENNKGILAREFSFHSYRSFSLLTTGSNPQQRLFFCGFFFQLRCPSAGRIEKEVQVKVAMKWNSQDPQTARWRQDFLQPVMFDLNKNLQQPRGRLALNDRSRKSSEAGGEAKGRFWTVSQSNNVHFGNTSVPGQKKTKNRDCKTSKASDQPEPINHPRTEQTACSFLFYFTWRWQSQDTLLLHLEQPAEVTVWATVPW